MDGLKKVFTMVGMGVLASALLVGCSQPKEEVKPDVKKEESVKKEDTKKQVEVDTPKQKAVSYEFNKKPEFIKEWNSYAKKNDLSSMDKLETNVMEFKDGITLFITPTKKDPEQMEMFQLKMNPSKVDKKLQEEAVETTAKALFPNLSKADIKQWQNLMEQAKKVDTSAKSLTFPMVKVGESHQAVFLHMDDNKKTKENEEFLMIQIQKITK
jgi:hypothetical protein